MRARSNRFAKVFSPPVILSICLLGSSIWAAQIDVTSTASSGIGTLRAAIVSANAAGADVITFGATTGLAGCPFTITLAAADGQLDPLIDPDTTIDGSACGVTLDGTNLAAGSDGLRVRASGITVRGLTIQNFSRDGMRIQPPPGGNKTVTGVVVTKNVFTGNFDGLRVSGGDGPDNEVTVTIANNEVSQNRDDGVIVNGSFGDAGDGGNTVKVVIDHNSIRDNQGEASSGATTGDGIRVFGGVGASGTGAAGGNTVVAVITNNEVHDNVDDGILVAGTGGSDASNHNVFARIVANTLANNGRPNATAGNAIVVRGGSTSAADPPSTLNTVHFLVANNASEGSEDDGIRVAGGFGNLHKVSGAISGNKIERNGFNGIGLSGGGGTDNTLANIAILDNEIAHSGNNGIRVTGGSDDDELSNILMNITIKGNTSKLNEGHGIAVVAGDAANNVAVAGVTDNSTNQNSRDGILVGSGVSGSGATPVSGNQAIANREDGIQINETGYVVLANEAKGSVGAGIDAPGNIDGGGNLAVGNGSCNTPLPLGCL